MDTIGIDRFTAAAQNVLNSSLDMARSLGHTYIGTEHILLSLLTVTDGVAYRILTEKGLDASSVRDLIIRSSGTGDASSAEPDDMSPRCRKVIEGASYLAVKYGQNYIGTEHFLLAITDERECMAYKLLVSAGQSPKAVYGDTVRCLSGFAPVSRKSVTVASEHTYEYRTALGDAPTLRQYGRDLCELAREGKLDPMIGREKETARVIRTLSRRTKNNPCLIGEAGVGKTAVAEGLAKLIINREVPENLCGKSIIALDIPSMIAGAKYRGEFEDRMKNVLSELSRLHDIILFIDELHIIVGAGAAEGAVDAASILKPALARSEIQMIGATTVSEYRRFIEKDAALERRFQPITVEEPTHNEAVKILLGLRPKYEKHHGLRISDEAIEAAVSLSERYISDRFLPDKAIDVIDEAAAKKSIAQSSAPSKLNELAERSKRLSDETETAIRQRNFELAAKLRDDDMKLKEEYVKAVGESRDTLAKEAELCADDIAEVVSELTGIPVKRLNCKDASRLLSLPDELRKAVIGQDEAIEAVCAALRRSRTGIADASRPQGSFIFAGPTGVGKTKLATALAEHMFGSQSSLIRLDMSEYMEKHSAAKLIGSPPGYIGYEDGGQLTERVRRHPYSVVLFDEMEKAHPDVFNLLLQILEDGILKDSHGRSVSFKSCIIILTSNIGSEYSGRRLTGFFGGADEKENDEKAHTLRALKESFKPELLNRFDEVIVFKNLGASELEKICEMMMNALKERLALRGTELIVEPSVCDHICRLCRDENYGARPIRRLIRREAEDKAASFLLLFPDCKKVALRMRGDSAEAYCPDGNPYVNQESRIPNSQ